MRSTLALLLLFGAVIGTDPCIPYTLPKEGTCDYTVDWQVNDHKHALATCLEYFPTTFVRGTRDEATGKAKCVVTAAYTCVHLESAHPDVFLMYDKCYSFPTDANGKYVKGKIDDYNKPDGLCKGGKLSVFYSHTHAKFLGMKANTLNIEKLWIGIDSDGRTIEKPNDMMHKTLWKLVEGDYWAGDQLKKLKADKDGKYTYPPEAKYFFMRTRTDHIMNRIQGSFERTTDAMEATFACEFESKFTPEQSWYCEKLPKLGIHAVYDKDEGKPEKLKPVEDRKPRCLYATANKYAFNGKKEDLASIKGCQEIPSVLHSSGMDDGTANPAKYVELNKKGAMRIAAYYEPHVVDAPYTQPKCQGSTTTDSQREQLFLKWRHFDHHGKIQRPSAAIMDWKALYPMNECSDFPGTSTTMGLRNGLKIDMPPEVRAKAVCSLTFLQECENRKPCGKQECTNTNTFQKNDDPNKAGFFTCQCPGQGVAYEKQSDDTCKWMHGDKCAWLMFTATAVANWRKAADVAAPTGYHEIYKIPPTDDPNVWDRNDAMYKAIVRDGCKLTAWSGAKDTFALLDKGEYGTHDVPQYEMGTLGKDFKGQGASTTTCTC